MFFTICSRSLVVMMEASKVIEGIGSVPILISDGFVGREGSLQTTSLDDPSLLVCSLILTFMVDSESVIVIFV